MNANYAINDFIAEYSNALPNSLCDSLIQHFKYAQSMGLTYNRMKSEGVPTLLKNDESLYYEDLEEVKGMNKTCHNFLTYFHDEILKTYKENFGLDQTYNQLVMPTVKIQLTKIGGGYHIFHHENGNFANKDRVLSVIAYLNDVEEGGETEFLYYHKRIKPEKGKLLIFPSTFTHTHRGNPPISGEKYILTGWVEMV